MKDITNKYLNGFLSALSFFTVIPLKKNYGITKYTLYFFTLTGLIVSIIPALLYFFVYKYNSIIAAVVAVSLIILIYGFNHLDALMDFGDSLMVSGYENKQRVIKDKYTGSGGIGLLFIVYINAIAFLTFFNNIDGFIIIISGELVSKYITLYSMNNMDSFNEGLGNIFMQKLNTKAFIYNAIPLFIAFILDFYNIIIFFIIFFIIKFSKTRINIDYHGINGDIIGSVGEVTRLLFYVISFIFIILNLKFYFLPSL